MHGSRNVTSVVVFTDLDGSLLNEHDYGYEEALPALARIRAARVPLVFVTSKTRREVERLQAAMDLREPFVVENGGGIFFPVGYDRLPPAAVSREGYGLVSLGRPYGEIRRFFQAAQARFDILGFGDMSVKDIADLTDSLSMRQLRRSATHATAKVMSRRMQNADATRFAPAQWRRDLHRVRTAVREVRGYLPPEIEVGSKIKCEYFQYEIIG